MILRTRDRFGLDPELLAADTAYGAAEMLGWLVESEGIEPHIPVFDKTERKDGAFPAADFTYDHAADEYRCPGGRALKPYWRNISKGRPEFGKDGTKRCPSSDDLGQGGLICNGGPGSLWFDSMPRSVGAANGVSLWSFA